MLTYVLEDILERKRENSTKLSKIGKLKRGFLNRRKNISNAKQRRGRTGKKISLALSRLARFKGESLASSALKKPLVLRVKSVIEKLD